MYHNNFSGAVITINPAEERPLVLLREKLGKNTAKPSVRMIARTGGIFNPCPTNPNLI